MAIEHLVDKFKDELPGYKISGYTEMCAPVFKRSLHCLMQNRGQLPVVVEFVLHYYNLGVGLEEIAPILGLDKELIEQAWWELVYHDFVDDRTKRITQEGQDYLQERRMEKREQALVQVCIDGILGSVKMDTTLLMANKQVRDNGLKSLRPVIPEPGVETIEFLKVKRVIGEYKKVDEELYDGDLIEIVNIEGNKTFFKRINILFYSNDDNNTRIAVYEGMERVEEYESALKILEANGDGILKPLNSKYPQANLISELDFGKEEHGPGKIFDDWTNLINNAKAEILISLPLLDICTPSDMLIEALAAAAKRGIQVMLLASGREFSSKHQKEQYVHLFQYAKKHKRLVLTQAPLLGNKLIIVDDNSGVISDFRRIPIYLPQSQEGFAEYGYSLNKQNVEKCKSIINPEIQKSDSLKPKRVDKQWLSTKMKTIIGLINKVDERLKDSSDKGWLGDSVIPNINALQTVPLASSEDSFKTFITAANISITESIEAVKKNYFWNEFKTICPSLLFHILEKIRMYRNFCNHIEIDEKYKSKFYQFLDEDLAGRLPYFIDNGFLYLQIKLLEDLETELRNALK